MEWMKQQGMESVHTDELGNVIWEYRPEQEKKVLYTAHLETVVLLSKGEIDSNMYQRSELDYLICNDPMGYADLVLNGNPGTYLKTVTKYKPLDS